MNRKCVLKLTADECAWLDGIYALQVSRLEDPARHALLKIDQDEAVMMPALAFGMKIADQRIGASGRARQHLRNRPAGPWIYWRPRWWNGG